MGITTVKEKAKMNDQTIKCEQNSKNEEGNKVNEVDRSTISDIAIVIESPPPKLFKLNVDCFEHLFEWLSLEELLVFRRTCKRMKLVVDYYIKLNYPKLLCCEILEREAGSKCLEWCRHLCISTIVWNDSDSESIKYVLNQLETLRLYYVHIESDLYDVLLKYCPGLKHLGMKPCIDYIPRPIVDNNRFGWVHRQYPTLEHFEIESWVSMGIHIQCTQLLKLFERNPNIRVFSTNSDFLIMNCHLLLESNIKFDCLNIKIEHDLNDICNLVGDLYKGEFYKQLHLYCCNSFHGQAHHLSAFHNLEKLDVYSLPEDSPLTKMNSLKELEIRSLESRFLTQLTLNLINLRCIRLNIANLRDISPIVCHAPKLQQIKIEYFIEICDLGSSYLVALNERRQKLHQACKITIYISEESFLGIKWEAKTNFSLIEFKRLESCEEKKVFEWRW